MSKMWWVFPGPKSRSETNAADRWQTKNVLLHQEIHQGRCKDRHFGCIHQKVMPQRCKAKLRNSADIRTKQRTNIRSWDRKLKQELIFSADIRVVLSRFGNLQIGAKTWITIQKGYQSLLPDLLCSSISHLINGFEKWEKKTKKTIHLCERKSGVLLFSNLCDAKIV